MNALRSVRPAPVNALAHRLARGRAHAFEVPVLGLLDYQLRCYAALPAFAGMTEGVGIPGARAMPRQGRCAACGGRRATRSCMRGAARR